MSDFTKIQPKDGDALLHCGHLNDNRKFEWFLIPHDDGVSFRRPDGTVGNAKWITVCLPCLQKFKDPMAVPIRGDGTWMGNAPAIRKMDYPGASG